MKCYCVTGFREPLQARDLPMPRAEGTEVLLQVRAAGVCHSDIHIWEGSYDLGHGRKLNLADRGISLPLTLGHETVGTIVGMGAQAEGVEIGRNYLVYPWIGCGECQVCQEGNENLCNTPQCLGVHRSGGYATHIVVPHARYLIDIGDLDPAVVAPYACSGLTTYSALNKIGTAAYQADPVVIFGAGGLGLMCLELLKTLGGAGAIMVDIDPAKRQAALAAGALAAIDGSAPDVAQRITQALGKPARSVIDLVGAPATTAAAFDCLGKGGKMIIVGLFGGAATWPITLIPIKAVSITGSYVGNLAELRELMGLVRAGRVQPIPVQRYQLEEADSVLMALHGGKITGRAVLTA